MPDGSGRVGRLILSISISKISFIIFPAEAVKPAESAARRTFSMGIFSGDDMNAATNTDTMVIKKFTGRTIDIADSFAFKLNTLFVS